MPEFFLFLDEVGAEHRRARTTRREAYIKSLLKPVYFTPTSIRPLELVDEKGAARRAATGYLLLGAGGAAAGVLMGNGAMVHFEMECADGVTRRGAIRQKMYPAMRVAVERIRRYRPGDERRLFWRWAAYILGSIVLVGVEQNPFFLFAIVPGMFLEVALDRWKLSRPVETFAGASAQA